VTRHYSSLGLDASPSSFRVERPRRTDAIASALRDAYAENAGVPDDMLAILGRLNGHSFHSRH
jgi:hypothetical protein